MKKLKNIKYFFFISSLSLVLGLMQCVSDDDSKKVRENKNLPSKIRVEIPNSLKNNGSSSSANAFIAANNATTKEISIARATNLGSPIGKQLVTNTINTMELLTGAFNLNFIIIDELIEQAKGRLGSKTQMAFQPGDIKVSITDEIKEAVKSQPGGDKITEFPTEKEISLAFCYKKQSSKATFDNELIVDANLDQISKSFPNICSPPSGSSIMQMFWSNDKKRFASTITTNIEGKQFSFALSHNDERKESQIRIQFESMKGYINIKSCGEKNCVEISSSTSLSVQGTSIVFSALAIADDDGGFVELNLNGSTSYQAASYQEASYQEAFNKNGSVTGYKIISGSNTIGNLDPGSNPYAQKAGLQSNGKLKRDKFNDFQADDVYISGSPSDPNDISFTLRD